MAERQHNAMPNSAFRIFNENGEQWLATIILGTALLGALAGTAIWFPIRFRKEMFAIVGVAMLDLDAFLASAGWVDALSAAVILIAAAVAASPAASLWDLDSDGACPSA